MSIAYPTNIHITAITPTTFTVEWDPVIGASSYDILLYVNGTFIPTYGHLGTSYTQSNVPFGATVTLSLITNAKGGASPPSPEKSMIFLPRPYATPPIPPQQSPVCLDRYPIPNSSKKPVYTFNRREFWSWGANPTGRNCVQGDTIIGPSD